MLAGCRVRERALFLPLRTPSELELQARWFAGDFGRSFVSTRGNHIDIVQFGSWNREAGPDFSNAAISVNGGTPVTVSFPPTANWDTWATASITVSLTAGTDTVRATATGAAGGPNLDSLDVS